MNNSGEEITYHDSLLSFNDGQDFFETVLGGMQRNEDVSDDGGSSSDSSSDEENEANDEENEANDEEDKTNCECKESSDEESPFLITEDETYIGGDVDDINNVDDVSPFLITEDETYIGGDVDDINNVDDVSPFLMNEDEKESDSEITGSAFIIDESDISIKDIQDIVGGMLQTI